MGEVTNIGWTGKTWNPWQGCEKVSEGCAECYMFRDMRRYRRNPAKVVRSKTTFYDPLKWARKGLQEYVFTCSWSDWFHRDADLWRPEAWEIIRQCPGLTFQLLTKRHGRIAANLPPGWGDGWPNAWLGVSVENQDWTRRLDELRRVPARLRFASVEPLLGPVDLRPWLDFLGWVVVGLESAGRVGEVSWLEDVARQCVEAGVPIFVKQDAAIAPGQQGRISDEVWRLKQIPAHLTPAAPVPAQTVLGLPA